MRLRDNILDERQGPDVTPSDALEIAAGREAEEGEEDFASVAESLLVRLRGDVRKQTRADVDERLGEWEPASAPADWRPFAYGAAFGAGLVLVTEIVLVVLLHFSH